MERVVKVGIVLVYLFLVCTLQGFETCMRIILGIRFPCFGYVGSLGYLQRVVTDISHNDYVLETAKVEYIFVLCNFIHHFVVKRGIPS